MGHSFKKRNKKGVAISNAFQNVLNESNRKPNKILVIKSSEFSNRSMKSKLEKNDVEMIQHIMKDNQLSLIDLLES